MALQAQDVLVALKLAASKDDKAPSYQKLASELLLSPSQVHASVKRASVARLVQAKCKKVRRRELQEFLVHGLKYVFPAEMGPVVRGVPTGHSAKPLSDLFGDADPLVWEDPEGSVRGESIKPIHKMAPGAARKDPCLHEALALVDALRSGRARERNAAEKMLKAWLSAG